MYDCLNENDVRVLVHKQIQIQEKMFSSKIFFLIFKIFKNIYSITFLYFNNNPQSVRIMKHSYTYFDL